MRRAGRAIECREGFGEFGDVGDLGAPEAVDGLIGVPCDRQIAARASQTLQEAGLGDGGVLVLVHQNERMLLSHGVTDGLVAEQGDRFRLEAPVVDAIAGR